MNSLPELQPVTNKRIPPAKFTRRLFIVLTVLFSGVAVYFLYLAINIRDWQYGVLAALAALVALAEIRATRLAQASKFEEAAFWTVVGICIVAVSSGALVNGFGLAASLAVFLVVVIIVDQILSGSAASSALAAGTISVIAAILLDVFASWDRLSIPLLQTVAPYLAAISVIILAVYIVRQFSKFPLRVKLVIVSLVITLVPLVILGYYLNVKLRTTLTQNTEQYLTQLSSQAALQVNTFIDDQLTAIKVTANNPAFAQYLDLAVPERVGSQQAKNAQDVLNALVSQRSDYLISYTLLDSQGHVILNSAGQTGQDQSQAQFFKKAIEQNRAVVTGPFFDQQTGNASIYFSVPVKNEAGTETVGVFYGAYYARQIQLIVSQLIPPGNPNGILIRIVDNVNYVRIAHTGNDSLLYKSYKDIQPDQIIALQKQGLLLPGPAKVVLAAEPDTVAGLQNLGKVPYFVTVSQTIGARTINTGTRLTSVPWLAFVRQSEATITQPLQEQTRTVLLIGLVLFVIAALAALIIAQGLSRPVLSLSSVAQTIAAGNLDARATITTQDEIGTLAHSFNQMADQLKDILGGLEKRVEERTTDLQTARLESERRAKQFEAVAEVARAINSTRDLDVLLVQITEVIHREFGFYHIGIFLLDTAREYAVLSASNSSGGHKMLARGHRLKVGETGIVGYVTSTGKPRLALDTGTDAVFFNNPDLPDTHSEVALPLRSSGEIVGALDVQSIETNAFNEDDVRILDTLADQVSIAIQNARQYEETRKALAESEALSRQFIQTGWSSFVRKQRLEGVRHTGAKSTLLYRKPGKGQSEDESDSLQLRPRGRGAILSLPVKLRGQVIGTVDIRSPENRQWEQDELDIVTAIIERSAIAMENARLLTESQKLVAKERTIGDIAAKISGQNEIEDLLKTAAQELARSLPGTQIAIQLDKDRETDHA
jgi:GAF domain-containing protein/HAMP domain-containing protein